MKRIGLLFGSFNPLHNGHLLLSDSAQKSTELDEVWFIVQPQNSYKPITELLDYDTRKNLIITSGLYLFEPKTKNYAHYILETLKEIKGADLTLILGEDLSASFPYWEDYHEIKELAQVYESPRLDDISSGLVRDRLQAGQPIDHLVPRSVADYLRP